MLHLKGTLGINYLQEDFNALIDESESRILRSNVNNSYLSQVHFYPKVSV